ncbi:MAG: DUF6326 family protein [Candidatus Hodarchaeota archaeon]
MEDTRIILTFIWVTLMLIYLLGDVLRIFVGDFTPGEIEGKPLTQKMAFGILVLMVIPIIMIVLTLILDYTVNRWANIIVAISFFLFNLVSLRGYSNYDRFLLIISLGFNVLTVLIAWNWVL